MYTVHDQCDRISYTDNNIRIGVDYRRCEIDQTIYLPSPRTNNTELPPSVVVVSAGY